MTRFFSESWLREWFATRLPQAETCCAEVSEGTRLVMSAGWLCGSVEERMFLCFFTTGTGVPSICATRFEMLLLWRRSLVKFTDFF